MNIEDIRGLFAQLALAYGKQFEDKWAGNDPDAMAEFWLQKLRRYEGREQVIIRALDEVTEMNKFPPNLAEFMEACDRISCRMARAEKPVEPDPFAAIEDRRTPAERLSLHERTMASIEKLKAQMKMPGGRAEA